MLYTPYGGVGGETSRYVGASPYAMLFDPDGVMVCPVGAIYISTGAAPVVCMDFDLFPPLWLLDFDLLHGNRIIPTLSITAIVHSYISSILSPLWLMSYFFHSCVACSITSARCFSIPMLISSA